MIVDRLTEHGTYAGLFIALVLGGLGLPVPEEVSILTAGVLSHQEIVRWWVALPVVLVGVVTGDVILYWIGRHFGETVLTWRYVRHFLTPERERVLSERYRQHGAKIVVAGRHFLGLRAAIFLTAGIVRLPFARFLAADAVTASVGASFSFFVAYLFTDHLEAIMRHVHHAERWVGLVGVIVAAIAVFLVHRRQRRFIEGRRDDDDRAA